ALRTPLHEAAGCGGFHRRSPTGGAAYGMPLKTITPSFDVPATRPFSVRTASGAVAISAHARATIEAPIETKVRRMMSSDAGRGTEVPRYVPRYSATLQSRATDPLQEIELRLEQMRPGGNRVAEVEVRFGVRVVRRPGGEARPVRIAGLDEVGPVARHAIGELAVDVGVGEIRLARIAGPENVEDVRDFARVKRPERGTPRMRRH